VEPSRPVSGAEGIAALGLLTAAWLGARIWLAAAWGLPLAGPGSLVFLGLLAAGAWALMDEPRWSPGGPAVAARWLGAGALLAAGEACMYYPIADRESLVGLGFGGLALGAWLLWPRPAGRMRWLVLAGSAAMLAAGALAPRDSHWDLFLWPPQAPALVRCFWAGLFASLAGLAAGAAQWRGPGAGPDPSLDRRLEAALLALVVAAAAALRFWHPAQWPEGYWLDEVSFAAYVRDRIVGLGQAPLYAGEQAGAYMWVCAAVFKAFGASVEALRISSGAFGLLALLPFWALARLWVGRRWALAATLCFGMMRWAAIPQRTAFLSSFALFWMLAAFWGLWSAHLKGGRLRWLLAGLLLGANLHTYTPARAVPVLCLAFLLLQAWLEPELRPARRDWLALGLGFAATGGPMLAYLALHWQDYAHRPAQVSIFSPANLAGQPLVQALWSNAARHLGMFQFRGDLNGRHNLSGYPQLDFLMACAAAPALPWVLGRAWRDGRGRFLCLWLGAAMAAGVLSLPSEAPQANRCILAAPAVALALAWALRELCAPLGRAFQGGWPRPALAMGLALLLGTALLNAAELWRWSQDPSTTLRFCPRGNAILRRVQASRPGTTVYLSALAHEPPYDGQECTDFAVFGLSQQKRYCNTLSLGQALISDSGPQRASGALLIWGESDQDISQAFQREFPGLAVERPPFLGAGPGDPACYYLAAEVPAERIPVWKQRGPMPLLFRLN
jgi:4-amino-4-deoxy-L-arabinose transferase-like glycosyltransferase